MGKMIWILMIVSAGLMAQSLPPSVPTLTVSPSYGRGMTAEYLIQSKAESVIVIVNNSISGWNGCYFVLDPKTAQIWVFSDSTGDWVGQGDQCRVVGRVEGDGVRIGIEYDKKWKGKRKVYVTERNGALTDPWSVAGDWEVSETEARWIRPAVRLVESVMPIEAVMRRMELDEWSWEVATRKEIRQGTVYRNGVKMTREVDYRWIGNERIQTLTAEAWSADDVVTVTSIQ